jgi:hypothetical protein
MCINFAKIEFVIIERIRLKIALFWIKLFQIRDYVFSISNTKFNNKFIFCLIFTNIILSYLILEFEKTKPSTYDWV